MFLCSPNNPTGNSVELEAIQFLLQNFKVLVILDEAYIDFSDKASTIELLSKYSNLVVLQTLSKAYGAAGLRIGMAFGNTNIIQYLNKVKPPYNVSTPNQELVIETIQEGCAIQDIVQERNRLSLALKGLSIVEKVYPSDANFLLFKVKDANAVYRQLLDQGIVIRNRNKQVKNCLRVSIGTSEQNNLFIQTLKAMCYAKSTVC